MSFGRLRCTFLNSYLTAIGIFFTATPLLLGQASVTVRIENLAPPNGNFLTPVWVGFHDGTFDLYDLDSPVTPGLESVAEDGATSTLSAEFLASTSGTVDATIVSGGAIPPLAPGQSTSMTFTLDPNVSGSRYFSYASMVIPSNDAFVANGDPMAHAVFDDSGKFVGASFIVMGTGVRDAGTEVNDEIPDNTAFFGQMAPNTGVDEGGTVQVHPGFLGAGNGGILDDAMFASADFTAPGYQIARITISLGDGQNLYFPQFGDGSGLFSQISLFGLNDTDTTATIILRDDDGQPLSVDLNGEVVDGEIEVTVPASGLVVLASDGQGDISAGSVAVRSTQPLNGVVLFGGSVGLEGILPSEVLETGFIAPVETNAAAGIDTGIAIMNVESGEVTVLLRLCDSNGDELARAQLDPPLVAKGHRARFVTEFEWDQPIDFSDFSGLLKVTASGKTAALVLQIRPDQLASIPVVAQ